MNVVIRDESMNREMLQEFNVAVAADRITVRDLIRTRVCQEFASENSQRVWASDIPNDKLPNNIARTTIMPSDWTSELAKALDAFITNRIVIFVNDRQVKSLDETIEIGTETKISFLRLGFMMGS